MNYWYVARANELFIDTDNASKSTKHARARLQGAIECGKLNVVYVMSRPSKSKNHVHTIITLKEPIAIWGERYVWEIILHGDIYRGCCNLMRYFYDVSSPDILISPWPYFYIKEQKEDSPAARYPDDKCNCTSKHTRAVMETCPAAIRLRGENRTRGFFGKPSKNPCTIWPEP